MSTRTDYEQYVLKEIRDLPESDLPKVLKMIRFLKEEIFQIKGAKEEDLEMFWESFGSWQDQRPTEEIIRDIYESRKSTVRDIQL